jgi:tRNA threonylcarbamoyladenosine biosynthesis protein TsaE
MLITAPLEDLSPVIAHIDTLILQGSRIFWFSGDVGSGKTTLISALTKHLGYTQAIGSPTYGLVHTYETPTCHIFHSDWYRIKSPAEIYDSGIEEDLYLTTQPQHSPTTFWFIEWAEMAESILSDYQYTKITITPSPSGNSRGYLIQ